jgi:hypothetical protein
MKGKFYGIEVADKKDITAFKTVGCSAPKLQI